MKTFIKSRSGLNLAADVHSSSGPLVILCHGFRSGKDEKSITSLAGALEKSGFSTLRFDFNGHGESQGDFRELTVTRALQDLHAILDYARTQFPARKISLVASSLGGMVALLASQKNRSISTLVLKSPVSDFQAMLEGQLQKGGIALWKSRGSLPAFDFQTRKPYVLDYGYFEDGIKHDVLAAAQNVRVPTLIILGDSDLLVPLEHSQKLLRIIGAPQKELMVFPGTDHGFEKAGERRRYHSAVVRWLKIHAQ